MKNILAILLVIIFAVISLLHIYWAFGGKNGSEAVIPNNNGKPIFNPSFSATLLVAFAFLLAILTVLGQIGWFGETIPAWIFRWACIGLSVVFCLRAFGEFKYVGFFKRVRNTKFAVWDSYFFSPLCLLIAICTFLIV